MTVHVHWPAKTNGAFGFGLNFLCFKTNKVKRTFAIGQKEQNSEFKRKVEFPSLNTD